MSDFWMFSLASFLSVVALAGFAILAIAAADSIIEGWPNRANVFFMIVGLLMTWLSFAGLWAVLGDEDPIKSEQCIIYQKD